LEKTSITNSSESTEESKELELFESYDEELDITLLSHCEIEEETHEWSYVCL
jgi:hypothetical protein